MKNFFGLIWFIIEGWIEDIFNHGK